MNGSKRVSDLKLLEKSKKHTKIALEAEMAERLREYCAIGEGYKVVVTCSGRLIGVSTTVNTEVRVNHQSYRCC